MDFHFMNSDDMPPEVQEFFQTMQHQNDMHEMAHQDFIHQVQDFLNRQSTEDLLIVRRLLVDAGQSGVRASNMIGCITGILSTKHEVCLCGQIHVPENAGFDAQESPEENHPGEA